jgi:hypothetical protein
MFNSKVNQCCHECGSTASILTALKKYGQPPEKIKSTLSTYHEGICDNCGKRKVVTEARDYFSPDFSLIARVVQELYDPEISTTVE